MNLHQPLASVPAHVAAADARHAHHTEPALPRLRRACLFPLLALLAGCGGGDVASELLDLGGVSIDGQGAVAFSGSDASAGSSGLSAR